MLAGEIYGAVTTDLISEVLDPPTPALIEEVLPATFGAVSVIDPIVLAPADAGLTQNPMSNFYYRIWVVPDTLRLTNPQFDVPIPFEIFNAYTETNTLTMIGSTGATGLGLDIDAPLAFGPLEVMRVELTITDAADPEVEALFTFTYTYGVGTLTVTGVIADSLPSVPETPVIERLQWLTDVLVARSGAEQRIALRGSPRRVISMTLAVDNEAQRRDRYLQWFRTLGTRVVIPFFQYAGVTNGASLAGDDTILVDTTRTDLRVGEFAMLYDPAIDVGYLQKVTAIAADSVTVETPLSVDVRDGMLLAPMFNCRINNRTGLAMQMKTGRVVLEAQTADQRLVFTRPGATVVLTELDDVPVLDRRPAVLGDVPETFDLDYEIIDSGTGVQDIKKTWLYPRVEGARSFLVQRWLDPEEMDWWRLFLSTVRGRQNPFYVPTYRDDLVLFDDPTPGSNQMVVVGTDYALIYFPREPYKALALQTTAGLVLRQVSSVEVVEGNTVVTMSGSLEDEEAEVQTVSFLQLCRLASDEVTLTHGHIDTQIDISIRTIDA